MINGHDQFESIFQINILYIITLNFSVVIDAKLIVHVQWNTLSDTDDLMNPGGKAPLLKAETLASSTVHFIEMDLKRDMTNQGQTI